MSDDHSSALKLVTPPATEPVTLAQAKTFLRIEHTADDDAITRAITAARKHAEAHLRHLLLPQTWDYSRANPCSTKLILPVGPALSVTSVTLMSELGATSTMDPAAYRLSVDGFALILRNMPQTEILKVRYTAGDFATASDVPLPIVQGILHHVAAMLENRDGGAALPVQSFSCYQPFRRVSL